jgi:hypothetical protein
MYRAETETDLDTETRVTNVGEPALEAVDGGIAEQPVLVDVDGKDGKGGLDEGDKLEDMANAVHGKETVPRGLGGVVEGEGATATAAHAEEIDVGVETGTEGGKVAGGDEDDGEIGGEAGEIGGHEGAVGRVSWTGTMLGVESGVGVPLIGVEDGDGDGMGGIGGVHGEGDDGCTGEDPGLYCVELKVGQHERVSVHRRCEMGALHRRIADKTSVFRRVIKCSSSVPSVHVP